jgi:hypothetical protein
MALSETKSSDATTVPPATAIAALLRTWRHPRLLISEFIKVLLLVMRKKCQRRSGPNAARSSTLKGCSQAAKCPPLSSSWKEMRLR